MPSVSTKPPLWAALPCPALRQRQRSGSSWLHLLVEKVDLERPLLRRQRDPVLDVLFAGQPRRDRCRVFERSQFVPRCVALLCVALHRYSRARALPCNGSPASPQQADRYCAVLLGHSRLSGPEGSEDRCCGPQCTVSTLRYSTVLYGPIQSSTVLYSTVGVLVLWATTQAPKHNLSASARGQARSHCAQTTTAALAQAGYPKGGSRAVRVVPSLKLLPQKAQTADIPDSPWGNPGCPAGPGLDSLISETP